MSTSFIGGIGFLLFLPVLLGQWVGLVGLARAGRSPAWWTMLVGTSLSTLGGAGQMVWMAMLASGAIDGFSSGPGGLVAMFAVIAGVTGLGSLVFAVGFAVHGWRSRRLGERIADLESVLAAQHEQLEREQAGPAR